MVLNKNIKVKVGTSLLLNQDIVVYISENDIPICDVDYNEGMEKIHKVTD